jgi:hypothetical protein
MNVLLLPLPLFLALPPGDGRAAKPTPEGRALTFLIHEVPRWAAENKCYSCHNNGDAARALYRAVKQSHPVPAEALADTSRWLSQPQRWDHNPGDPAVSDKGLARIQFAAALVEALDAGQVTDKQALQKAAELVAEHQRPDGSWRVDADGNTGSPATYGTALATGMARRTLRRADPERFREALSRADRWLGSAPVASVIDAAAVLLALDGRNDRATAEQRARCLAVIRKGQGKDGGWGPYVNSPAEAFDTALVLLALAKRKDPEDVPGMRQRGRAFLLALQQADGSWPETTRPAGSESYAQRLSTTGWAALALLATTADTPGRRRD